MKTILHSVCLSLMLILSLMNCACSNGELTEQRKQQYQALCRPIIEWLETQYSVSNRYPCTLPDEIASQLMTINCYGSYSVYGTNDDQYTLRIGDYMKDGWLYYWSSKDKHWHVDR